MRRSGEFDRDYLGIPLRRNAPVSSKRKNREVLKWPTNSSNLNPIESFLANLQQHLRRVHYKISKSSARCLNSKCFFL